MMPKINASGAVRQPSLLQRFRRPWTGWVQLLAMVFMVFGQAPLGWATWSDTDSNGSNDTWTDPATSQVTTLANMNLQNSDADNDGATNDEEATEGSDPFSYDTDYDGISDGDELHLVKPILGVSLTDWDSDGDYVSDYDEWYNFSDVVYTGGQLPNIPNATYSDYDGDGYKNPVDPFPTDPDNYSSINGISWYGDVFGDVDNDGLYNWEDPDTWVPPDTDGDGIDDNTDPFPSDDTNFSSLNNTAWYSDVFGDADSDGSLNWEDSDPYGSPSSFDTDGDGISDASDPFPGDSSNYSATNGVTWYGDVFGDADGDGIQNWMDPDPTGTGNYDSDGDGFLDLEDPFPSDINNYSSINDTSWYGDVLGDADSDGMLNWEDPWPQEPVHDDTDSDGLIDSQDPFPQDSTNYSSINQIEWNSNVLGDDDVDGFVNWQDQWPYDAANGGGSPDHDGDGLNQDDEDTYGTSNWDPDCDDDGLTDREELMVYSTDPLNAYSSSIAQGWGELYTDYELADNADTDGDGIPDRIEEHYGMQPNDPSDSMGDLDGNGISNHAQYNAGMALDVDLNLYDADADGMTDIFEDYYGLNKYLFADAVADADNDGVLNFEESELVLSPVHADSLSRRGLGDLTFLIEAILDPDGNESPADADNDDIPDWMETELIVNNPVFTRLAPSDLDGDGMSDVWEHQFGRWKYPASGMYIRYNDALDDADDDGMTNLQEYQFSTHPLIGDTDGDGNEDGAEDPDEDGLTNAQEIVLGTDPWDTDSDNDTYTDGAEHLAGSNPLDAGSTPEDPGGSGGGGGPNEPPPTPEEEEERAVFTAIRQKKYIFSGITALPRPPQGQDNGEKWYIDQPVTSSSDATPADDGFNGDASLDDNNEDPFDPRDEGDDSIPDDGIDSNFDGDNDDPSEPSTVRVEVDSSHEGADPEPVPSWKPYEATPSASQNFSYWRVHNLIREVPPSISTSTSAWQFPRDVASRMSAIGYHRPTKDAATHGWRGWGSMGVMGARGGGIWTSGKAPNVVEVETDGQTSTETVQTDWNAVEVDYYQVRLQTNLVVPEGQSISRTFLIVERSGPVPANSSVPETVTPKGTVTLIIPAGKRYATEAVTTGTAGNYVTTIGGFKVVKLETEPEAANSEKYLDLLPLNFDLHKRGTINDPGAEVPRPSDANSVYEVVTLENADWDEQENWTPDSMAAAGETDKQDGATDSVNLTTDDDFVKIRLQCHLPEMSGSLKLLMDKAGEGERMRTNDLRFYDAQGQRIQLTDLKIDDLKSPAGPLAPILEDGLDLFVEIADLGMLTRASGEANRARRKYADLILRLSSGGKETDLKARIYRGGVWRNQRTGNSGTTAFYDGKGRYQDAESQWQTHLGELVHGPYGIQSGNGGVTDETVPNKGPTPAGWYGLYERLDFRTWWDRNARPQTDHTTNAAGQPLGYLQQGSYCQWDAHGNRTAYTHTGANPPASVRFKFELVEAYEFTTRTNLQIHPDGFNDGTAGCLGLQTFQECCEVFYLLRNYFGTQVVVESSGP